MNRVPSGWSLGGHASLLVVLVAALSAPAAGQTLVGRVLDEVGERPLGGAVVALVARTGEARDRTVTDADGRFTLTPPEEGEYLITSERFGYPSTRSPLFALTTEGEVPIELLMSPEPIGLEGLDVTVEELAVEELDAMGLSVDQMGNRWIARTRIDAIPVKRDLGTIIEHAAQAGFRWCARRTPASGRTSACASPSGVRRDRGGVPAPWSCWTESPSPASRRWTSTRTQWRAWRCWSPGRPPSATGPWGGGGALLVWTRRGR